MFRPAKNKAMKLSDFQKKYRHHISKGLSFHHISRIRERMDLDFNVYLPSKGMDLQRELCWTLEQKRALVLTVLRDQPVSPMVVIQVNERNTGEKYNWQVIDGKQRLNAIFEYMDGGFSIVFEGDEYYFNGLPIDCQKQISWYDFKWDVHYHYDDEPITDETKISLFEEINFLGTPVDIQHLNKLKQ